MTNSKYDEEDHRRAFELWKNKGLSYREIEKSSERMPSYETIKRWALGEVECDCPYHNWREKRAELLEQAREEVKDELDLPDQVEREKNQLRLIYRTQKQIEELLKSGELETPKDMETAVRLLKELNDEERILRGEAQSVTELRGADNRTLNMQKIAKQLNIGDPQELIEAVEDSIIESEVVENE